MPPRRPDLISGNHYHLYNRGNNRQAIFFEKENYLYFLRRFRHFVTTQTVHVLAYCLMPNHYHFLIQLRQENLSAAMRRFTLSYTNAINRRYNRCGVLFQGRFQTRLVANDEYLLHLTRYLHLNPVQAGLVKRPEDWEFSSYQDYVDLRQGTLPQRDKILQLVGTAQAYRQFVESLDVGPPTAMEEILLD